MNWKLTIEIISVIGGIATFFALILAPMFYLGSKIDSLREEMTKESKDFHKRLCEIEAGNKK